MSRSSFEDGIVIYYSLGGIRYTVYGIRYTIYESRETTSFLRFHYTIRLFPLRCSLHPLLYILGERIQRFDSPPSSTSFHR